MPILETKHLGKVYEGKVPYTALQDINFKMEKRRICRHYGAIRQRKKHPAECDLHHRPSHQRQCGPLTGMRPT